MLGITKKLGLAAFTLALLAGCGSPSDTTATGGTGGSDTTTGTGGTGGTGGDTTSSNTGGTGGSDTTTGTGGSAPAPEFIAHFDPAKGELAEGLFVDGGKAYVGFAPLGTIVTVDTSSGEVTPFGAIPPIPQNGGFMLGIVKNAAGDVLVGFGGGPGDVVTNGVYKLPPAGGSVSEPFATDPEMNFPNGLLLDGADVVVSDSGGAIFKIAPNGAVTKWLSDPLLANPASNCQFGAPFPLGTNGLVKIGSAYYAANTNAAQIMKIAINGDGSPGTPSLFAGPDCDALGGIDGLAVDAAGTGLLAVVNSQSKLLHIDASGAITTLLTGAPLDNPASISLDGAGSSARALITNASFFSGSPQPGLVAVPLP